MKAISVKIFSYEPIQRIPLSRFIKMGKAGGTPTSTNKEFYNGNIPFLSINDITIQGKYIYTTQKFISNRGLENSSAWLVPPYSLILSMYASVGLPTINKIHLATSQAMYSMVLNDECFVDYLYYYLLYFKDRHVYKYLETGTQSNINADIVRSICIPDYGKKQNVEIGVCLSEIDKKIALEQQVLFDYQEQKQYLLQQMFI